MTSSRKLRPLDIVMPADRSREWMAGEVTGRIRSDMGALGLGNFREKGLRIGIALSGGADSVALLCLGHLLGWEMHAVHCNFHLRGYESDRDEAFVRQICTKFAVPLTVASFDTMREKQPGESVEMAARRLRYAEFEAVAAREKLQAFALGHNRDDNAETFLINASRGSGLRGMKGIPAQAGIYIRPLLLRSKQGICDWLEMMGMEHVEDSSNATDEFLRNRIRHHAIPALLGANPDSVKGITATMLNLGNDWKLLRSLVEEKCREYVRPDEGILVGEMRGKEPEYLALLYHMLDGELDMDRIIGVFNSIDSSGKLFPGRTGRSFLLDRGVLKPVDASCDKGLEDNCFCVRIPVAEIVSRLGEVPKGEGVEWIIDDGETRLKLTARLTAFRPERNRNKIWFDARCFLAGGSGCATAGGSGCATANVPESGKDLKYPVMRHRDIVIRHPRRADRMRPFGMKGTRLLSDIFSDAKYPLDSKRRAWVMEAGGEIVWLTGLCQGAFCPVTDPSREILEFCAENPEENS